MRPTVAVPAFSRRAGVARDRRGVGHPGSVHSDLPVPGVDHVAGAAPVNNDWTGPESPRRPGCPWVIAMFLGLVAYAAWSLI